MRALWSRIWERVPGPECWQCEAPMAVEIALTPDSWWEIDVSDQVKAAREAGFTSLGIKAEQADDGARAMFDAAGLRCHEVLALIITDNEAATLRSAAHNAAAAERMG